MKHSYTLKISITRDDGTKSLEIITKPFSSEKNFKKISKEFGEILKNAPYLVNLKWKISDKEGGIYFMRYYLLFKFLEFLEIKQIALIVLVFIMQLSGQITILLQAKKWSRIYTINMNKIQKIFVKKYYTK